MTPTAAGQVQELLATAAAREGLRPDDARTGAVYERVTIGGDAYFVKRLSPASDWIMRITGDHVGERGVKEAGEGGEIDAGQVADHDAARARFRRWPGRCKRG